MANGEKSILSLRLRLLRIASGMKQDDVAQVLGIGRSAYTYYELARSRPDCDALVRLAKLYKVSIDYLVGISNFPDGNRALKNEEDQQEHDIVAPEASFGKLTANERYLLGVYRQLSEQTQAEVLGTMEKKRDRGE